MTDKDEIARLKDLFGRFAIKICDATPEYMVKVYGGGISLAEAQEIIGYGKAECKAIFLRSGAIEIEAPEGSTPPSDETLRQYMR